jgi:hypothetical protein
MKPSVLAGSETAAWVLGAFALGVVSALAYWQVGWLGVGLLGLVGLVVSIRLDLHGGHAVIDTGQGDGAVKLFARQLERQADDSTPEAKMAASERRARRKRVAYLLNTVFIAMMAFGFGLFVLHQL